ncbi:MAG: type I glutamate--ammonia ligase [Thermoprotei archaeon]|nr:type I glutamate--ammonia ligase [Thermoprotei archaeon]
MGVRGLEETKLKKVEERLSNVKFVDLWFVDLFGSLRHVTVTKPPFLEGLREGFLTKLDGSSIKGFSEIEESDLNLAPDVSSMILDGNIAYVFCYVLKPNGEFHTSDSRYLAELAEEKLREQGLTSYWGPEPEFFVFNEVKIDVKEPWFQHVEIKSEEAPWCGGLLLPKQAYYRVPPSDRLMEYRNKLVESLEQWGITVDCHHHEVATAGQIEVNMRCNTLRKMCDSIMILKYLAKSLAVKMGLFATFMPKPIYGDNGSGMHTHQSLFRGDENLFHDPDDDYAMLSQLARYYIGGLLEHSRALAAIVAPTVNSYKRLVPGYEAPVYLVWSRANRSAAVRIPAYNVKNPMIKRIEFRPPDPSCNPYMAFIAMLAAGLDGINKKIDPGDPVDENIYHMPPSKRRSIRSLPASLIEALEELESDNDFLHPFIPREVLEKYIEHKLKEAREVNLRPSPIEYLLYLDV